MPCHSLSCRLTELPAEPRDAAMLRTLRTVPDLSPEARNVLSAAAFVPAQQEGRLLAPAHLYDPRSEALTALLDPGRHCPSGQFADAEEVRMDFRLLCRPMPPRTANKCHGGKHKRAVARTCSQPWAQVIRATASNARLAFPGCVCLQWRYARVIHNGALSIL